jgi:hypothetical protein
MVDCFLLLVTRDKDLDVTDFFVPIYRLSNIDHVLLSIGRIGTFLKPKISRSSSRVQNY